MRRWTVDEYHTMIRAGVFGRDEQFELLEGWVVPKMSRNPPHDVALDKSQEAIRQRLPRGWRLRVQSAITTKDSEPEPDIAVVRGPAERYLEQHPGSADIQLVVEISESSLPEDRREKMRIYARAGIPTYWIINLVNAQVEVYTRPTGPTANPAYDEQQSYSATDLVPLYVEGSELESVAVLDLLP
jgi:Uma2 family endonuclease